MQRWGVEWGGAGALTGQGVTRDSLKPGDHVIITGNPGRNRDRSPRPHAHVAAPVRQVRLGPERRNVRLSIRARDRRIGRARLLGHTLAHRDASATHVRRAAAPVQGELAGGLLFQRRGDAQALSHGAASHGRDAALPPPVRSLDGRVRDAARAAPRARAARDDAERAARDARDEPGRNHEGAEAARGEGLRLAQVGHVRQAPQSRAAHVGRQGEDHEGAAGRPRVRRASCSAAFSASAIRSAWRSCCASCS